MFNNVPVLDSVIFLLCDLYFIKAVFHLKRNNQSFLYVMFSMSCVHLCVKTLWEDGMRTMNES